MQYRAKRVVAALVIGICLVSILGSSHYADCIAVSPPPPVPYAFARAISPSGLFPRGTNLVALPYANAYVTAEDICAVFGLTAGVGRVLQIDAANGVVRAHFCGNAGPFPLLPNVGVRVTNPVAVVGALAGGHPVGVTNTLFAQGAFPRGTNDFPIRYDTISVNAQDVCDHSCLGAGARVQRINAATGVVQTHFCGNAGPFNIVIGEALIVTTPVAVTFGPH